MMQYYLHIQHPEQLEDEVWAEKFAQLQDIKSKESKNVTI